MELGEIIWVAAIVEGEGTIGLYKSPTIKINMTDEDVVARFSSIVGSKYYKHHYPGFGKTTKPQYHVRIYGDRAIKWMHDIYWFLGERRQQKILEVFREWEKRPGKGRR